MSRTIPQKAQNFLIFSRILMDMVNGVTSVFSHGMQSSTGSSSFIVYSSQACPYPSTSSFFPSSSDRTSQSSPLHLPLAIVFFQNSNSYLNNEFAYSLGSLPLVIFWELPQSQWILPYPNLLWIYWSSSLKIPSKGYLPASFQLYYLILVSPLTYNIFSSLLGPLQPQACYAMI